MPLLPKQDSIAHFDDKRRQRLFDMQERVGSVAPEKGGVFAEGAEGIVSGATQVAKGLSSTLEEFGISSPLEAVQRFERTHQQFNPSEDYEAFSLDPANLARTITTGVTQAAAGLGAGLVTSAVTGNPLAGGAVTFASTFGQTYGEEVKDFRRDMSEEDAQLYGFASSVGQALLESVLGPERMVGGIAKLAGREAVEETVKKVGKERFLAVMKKAITSGLEEGSEEVLQDILSNAVAKTGGREGDVLPSVRELANTFAAGALPGMLLGGGVKAIQTRGGEASVADQPVTTDIDQALAQTLQPQDGPQLPVIGEGIDPDAPIEVVDIEEQTKPLKAEDIPKVEEDGKRIKVAKPQILTTGEGDAKFVDRIAIKSNKDVTKQGVEFLQSVIDSEGLTDIDQINEDLLIQVFTEIEEVVKDEKTVDSIINKIQKKIKFKEGAVTPVVETQIEEPVIELELEDDSELDIVSDESKQSMGAVLQNLPEGMRAKRTATGWEIVPIETSKTAQLLKGEKPRTEPLITPVVEDEITPTEPIDPNLENTAVKSEDGVTNQAIDFLTKYTERENIDNFGDIPNDVLAAVMDDLEKFIKEDDVLDRVLGKVGRVIQRQLEAKEISRPVQDVKAVDEFIQAVPGNMTVEKTDTGFKITPKNQSSTAQRLSGTQFQVSGVSDTKADPQNRINNLKTALPYADVEQTSNTTATVTLPNGQIITVQLVDNIQTPQGQQARGSFISTNNVIQLSSNSDLGTIDHEVFHAAKAISGLTESDQKVLDKAFKGDEELEAEAYRKYQDAKRKPRGPIAQVFDKIKAAMTKMARAFGYNSKNVVFDKVASGDVFQDQGVATPQTEEQFQVVQPQNSDSTERRQAVPFVTPEARAANEGLQEGRDVSVQRDVEVAREADDFIEARGIENVIKDISEGRIKMDSNLNKQIMNKALDDPSITQMYIDGDQLAMDAMAEWIAQRSEAGRILRLESSLTGDPIKDVQNNVKKMLLAPSKAYKQAKPGRKKEALQKEKRLIQDAVNNVKKVTKGKVDPLAITDEQAQDSKLMAKVMREIATTKAALGDKLYEYWINSILSGFTTHATNMVGNLALSANEIGPQRLIEATINTFRNDPKSATFGEISREWKSMFKAIKPALADAKLAWEMEMPTDGISKLEQPGVAIGGTLGRVIRSFGTRVLLASDELAKTIINAGESTAFAYRQALEEGASDPDARVTEILADPNAEVREIAHNRSLEMLHQQETGVFVAMLGQLAKRPGIEGWIGKILFPFRKTPANIIKTSLRKSPLGALKVFSDVATGQFSGDKATRQVAEQIMSWSAVGLLYGMIGGEGDDEIFITGTQSEFGTAKSNWERQNLPPSSIKIGGTWYDYGRVEPFGTILGMTVDGINAWQMAEDGVEADKIVKKVFNSMKENIVNQTFLQNLNDAIKTVESPEGLPRYATNFIASWVPNVYRGTVSKINDTIEDRRNYARGTEWLQYQFGTLVAQKAGFIKGAPRVDTWGRDVENRNGLQTGSPFMTAVWRASSPMRTMPEDMEKVDQLVMNFNQANPSEEWWPNIPQHWYSKSGKTLYMDKEQYHSYAKRSGRLAKGKIDSLIRAGKLNVKNPTKRDIAVIRKIITGARKRARISEGL